MEVEELRGLSATEMAQKKRELIDEIFHLRLKRGTNQLENPMKLRQVKRDLARIETVIRERQGK
jgi:large subunit ribosomal protein L29